MYLFTNFLLFILIWLIIFINLPMKKLFPIIQVEGNGASSQKYIYIRLEVYITTAISLLIMKLNLIWN